VNSLPTNYLLQTEVIADVNNFNTGMSQAEKQLMSLGAAGMALNTVFTNLQRSISAFNASLKNLNSTSFTNIRSNLKALQTLGRINIQTKVDHSGVDQVITKLKSAHMLRNINIQTKVYMIPVNNLITKLKTAHALNDIRIKTQSDNKGVNDVVKKLDSIKILLTHPMELRIKAELTPLNSVVTKLMVIKKLLEVPMNLRLNGSQANSVFANIRSLFAGMRGIRIEADNSRIAETLRVLNRIIIAINKINGSRIRVDINGNPLGDLRRRTDHATDGIEALRNSVRNLKKDMYLLAGVGYIFTGGWISEKLWEAFVKPNMELEKMKISFEVLLKDKEKAKTLIDWTIKEAAVSPFESRGMQDFAMKMLGANLDPIKHYQVLKDLGASPSPLGLTSDQNLSELGRIIGLASGGQIGLAMDSMASFFPVISRASMKQSAGSKFDSQNQYMGDFKDWLEDLKITVADRLGGMSERIGKETVSGRLSTLSDIYNIRKKDIGDVKLYGLVSYEIEKLTKLLLRVKPENVEAIGKALADMVKVGLEVVKVFGAIVYLFLINWQTIRFPIVTATFALVGFYTASLLVATFRPIFVFLRMLYAGFMSLIIIQRARFWLVSFMLTVNGTGPIAVLSALIRRLALAFAFLRSQIVAQGLLTFLRSFGRLALSLLNPIKLLTLGVKGLGAAFSFLTTATGLRLIIMLAAIAIGIAGMTGMLDGIFEKYPSLKEFFGFSPAFASDFDYDEAVKKALSEQDEALKGSDLTSIPGYQENDITAIALAIRTTKEKYDDIRNRIMSERDRDLENLKQKDPDAEQSDEYKKIQQEADKKLLEINKKLIDELNVIGDKKTSDEDRNKLLAAIAETQKESAEYLNDIKYNTMQNQYSATKQHGDLVTSLASGKKDVGLLQYLVQNPFGLREESPMYRQLSKNYSMDIIESLKDQFKRLTEQRNKFVDQGYGEGSDQLMQIDLDLLNVQKEALGHLDEIKKSLNQGSFNLPSGISPITLYDYHSGKPGGTRSMTFKDSKFTVQVKQLADIGNSSFEDEISRAVARWSG